MKIRQAALIFTGMAAIVTVIAVAVKEPAEAEEEPQPEISLNERLANGMSDFPECGKMDARIRKYMDYWHLKGTQVAVLRNDSLVFCKAYGIADSLHTAANPDSTEALTPGHIMRVASVSKLITATGIMKMQEMGLLHLSDTIFGPRGLLKEVSAYIPDKLMKDYGGITVEHLLRHQAGFRRDPVFSARDVSKQMKLDGPPALDDYCRLVLGKRLRYAPGKGQTYSNFGYMLLSAIIEEVSGQSYEEFIQENVLRPCGCVDMHIAGNYYEDRRSNESRYFTHAGNGKTVREYNGSDRMVERCYGGNDINLLQGAGAWVCSAAELALLVASIDGKSEVADILLPESVEEMTAYRDRETFSIGWNDTDPKKGWVRTGTLAGTNAVIKYFPDGECWIFISNSSTWKGPAHFRYTCQLFDVLRESYSGRLPARNLFEAI